MTDKTDRKVTNNLTDNNLRNNKVVSIFDAKSLHPPQNPIIRIAPELDGLEMLYNNCNSENKLYSLKIAGWALRADGCVQGLVPWLNELMPCTEINDPLDGQWQGYRYPSGKQVFYEAPPYKESELKAAAKHYSPQGCEKISTQEIPDCIGTHAALTDNGFKTLTLIEIHSWKLDERGQVHAHFADNRFTSNEPSIPAEVPSLISSECHPDFKYFFQHQMATKIKNQDPEALAAISLLIESG